MFFRLRNPTGTHVHTCSRKKSSIRLDIIPKTLETLIPSQKNTHTPTHTSTTQQHPTAAQTLARLLSLLLLLAASQRGIFLAPPASSVYHTMAAARGIDDIWQHQRLRLMLLWRLSAECTATNLAMSAFGLVQHHQPAWTRVRCA